MTQTQKYTCDSCKKDTCPLLIPLCMEGVYWADIIIPQIGCASHSDFQSGRDKVLDEATEKIWEQTFVPYGAFPEYHIVAWDTIKKILQELRQEGTP